MLVKSDRIGFAPSVMTTYLVLELLELRGVDAAVGSQLAGVAPVIAQSETAA